LALLHSNRVRRATATMLRDNLDPATSQVGLDVKVLAGAVFAAVVQDEHLAEDVRALAAHAGVRAADMDAATAFATGGGAPASRNPTVLTLARAASTSPAAVDADTVSACRTASLSAAAIVEVVCWLSMLQLLHRMSCWTAAR
jgi:hypothetical protein